MADEPGQRHDSGRGRDPGRVVRPYAITRGRIRRVHGELELETLITTTSRGISATRLPNEQRAIVLLCRDLLSIAEVAARLRLPVEVVRTLVEDMADEGLVELHRPSHRDDRPDLALLERVLYGLQNLPSTSQSPLADRPLP
jgi:hypothetical protein